MACGVWRVGVAQLSGGVWTWYSKVHGKMVRRSKAVGCSFACLLAARQVPASNLGPAPWWDSEQQRRG
jgi:hypothetical protein